MLQPLPGSPRSTGRSPIRCGWIAPQLRKAGSQRENRRALFLVQELSILRALLFTAWRRFSQQPQLVVPVCIEGISRQAVIRIDTPR